MHLRISGQSFRLRRSALELQPWIADYLIATSLEGIVCHNFVVACQSGTGQVAKIEKSLLSALQISTYLESKARQSGPRTRFYPDQIQISCLR